MPDNMINLEQKAAEVLARQQAALNNQQTQADTPAQSPIQTTPIGAEGTPEAAIGTGTPSADAVRNAGYMTAEDVVIGQNNDPDLGDNLVLSGTGNPNPVVLSDEDEGIILSGVARDNMKHMPDDEQQAFLEKLMPDMANYKKSLIVEYGMTPAEAAAAVESRVKMKAIEADRAWAEAHPNGVVVTIDKRQEEDVLTQFTDDERQKIVRAQAIKLVVVENAELETIKVNPERKNLSMSNIRDISASLSHFSVPLLATADYATFVGAQTAQLANVTSGEEDTAIDILEKKASLLYQCFHRATLHSRIKADGKEESYEDFCNWYHYSDLDLGIYAVVTASAMETTNSSYRCQNRQCNKFFDISYNNKALLDLSMLPEGEKAKVELIDQNRAKPTELKRLADDWTASVRLKSPISNNIFEHQDPTVAQVRHRLEKVEDMFKDDALGALIIMYCSKIWVWDGKQEEYVLCDIDEDPIFAANVIKSLHTIDQQIVTKYIGEHLASPRFRITTKCPHCNREATDNLSIDAMVFLHVRASLMEIQS